MDTIWGNVTEKITSEVNLFGSMMNQNVIENKFNRIYAPLATIQQNVAIEFRVKGANDMYLDLNNSCIHVLVKFTKASGTNIEANTAASIREIGLELNGRNVSDTSQRTSIAQTWRLFWISAKKSKKHINWAMYW